MSGALEGIRLVEFGRMTAAPWCARLLADLGADCLKVERPGGDPMRRRGPFPGDAPDPERGGLFHYLNTNKRGAVLDPATADGAAALRRALAAADLFIHDLQPAEAAALALDYPSLRRVNPRLIVTAVTPWGSSGPEADAPGGELVEWAAGGYAHLTPAGGRREGGRPLKPAGNQSGFMTGASAAAATLGALLWRERGGSGQFVDVSIQETLIVANDSTFAPYMNGAETIPTRLSPSTFEFMPCRDGYLSLLFVRDDQWQRMAELMGNPEWALMDLFATGAARRNNWDALAGLLIDYFMQYGPEELYRAAQARRIPIAPVNSAGDVLASPHLRARDYFVNLALPDGAKVTAPGAPYKLARTPWAVRRPAPRLTDPTDAVIEEFLAGDPAPSPTPAAPAPLSHGPRVAPAKPPRALAGVRVMDFTWVWAGPQCCRLLADMGAEVIKIESDRRIDNYRTAPRPDGQPYGLNRAPGFLTMNRNKLSVRINLSCPEGREAALRLAAVSDLVVQNYAPRVMPGFGLSWDDFAAVNPAIVMLSMSGFGATGPDRDYVLYGNSQTALAGLGFASGFPGGPPENIANAHGDPISAYHGAVAALSAVLSARRTGRGQHIDMSQWEAMTATVPDGVLDFAMNGREPVRQGNADTLMAPHGYYRCAVKSGRPAHDPIQPPDAWIGIAVATDSQWRALRRVMGDPAWAADARFATEEGRLASAAELDRHIEAWTTDKDAIALTRELRAAGVAAAPVTDIADIVADPHLRARGFFEEIDHAEAGRQAYIGVPFHHSETPAMLWRHAPLFGGDGDYVLRDVLGLSDAEIARYEAAGALH